MEEDLPLQRVTIGGSTLASLLHRSSASPGDTDGVLFGHVSLIAPPSLSDDHSSNSASLRRFLHPSPSRPSLREFSVSRSLSSDRKFSSSIENSSSDFSPSIFLLITSPNPQTLIHSHDYRLYQLRSSATAFEARPLNIVNIGPDFRGQYSHFGPNSKLPYLPCKFKDPSMNKEAAEGTDSLTYMKKVVEDQRHLELYVEGSRVWDLNKLLGSRSSNYTSGLEDLYENSIAKLRSLAMVVESSSAKVLEMENHNARLRDKVAGLE